MRNLLLGVLALGVVAVTAAQGANVSDLIAKLTNKDEEVRRAAAKELGELGKEAKEAVPALIGRLRDKDRFVRRFAAEALGNIGADAKDVISKLGGATNDDRKEVAQAAVDALGKLGTSAVPELTGALKDPNRDPTVRVRVAQVLGKMGSEARGAVKTMTQVLTGKVSSPKVKGKKKKGKMVGDDLRVEVAVALGDVATAEDTEAVEALRSIAEGKGNRAVKKVAGESLRKITGMGPKKKKKKK